MAEEGPRLVLQTCDCGGGRDQTGWCAVTWGDPGASLRFLFARESISLARARYHLLTSVSSIVRRPITDVRAQIEGRDAARVTAGSRPDRQSVLCRHDSHTSAAPASGPLWPRGLTTHKVPAVTHCYHISCVLHRALVWLCRTLNLCSSFIVIVRK